MKKTEHFAITLEQDEDGIFIVSCPQFVGCHSYGKTVDEAMVNIKECIELCLEDEKFVQGKNKFLGVRDLEIEVL